MTLLLAPDNPPSFLDRFERGIVANLEMGIREWSDCRRQIAEWEDSRLLADPTNPSLLSDHKAILQRMIFFGQAYSLATSDPDFPDTRLNDEVQACLWALRENFRAWHSNPITEQDASKVLAEVFPES